MNVYCDWCVFSVPFHSCLRPKYLLPLLPQQTTFQQETSKSTCFQAHYSFEAWKLWTNKTMILFNLHSFYSPILHPLALSVDSTTLLPKAVVGVGSSLDSDLGMIVDGPSAEDLGQSLVFTNSHRNGHTTTHSYAHATANSYAHAASGSTTYAHAALVRLLIHTRTHLLLIYWIIVFSSFDPLTFSVLSSGLWFWITKPSQVHNCFWHKDIRAAQWVSGCSKSQSAIGFFHQQWCSQRCSSTSYTESSS